MKWSSTHNLKKEPTVDPKDARNQRGTEGVGGLSVAVQSAPNGPVNGRDAGVQAKSSVLSLTAFASE